MYAVEEKWLKLHSLSSQHDGTRPLPGPLLTYHQRRSLESPKSNFLVSAQKFYQLHGFGDYTFKITGNAHRVQWINHLEFHASAFRFSENVLHGLRLQTSTEDGWYQWLNVRHPWWLITVKYTISLYDGDCGATTKIVKRHPILCFD